jgi:hypothetical protein
VKGVVRPVLDRGDAPDDPIAVAREEELAVGLVVEGMLLSIERIVHRRAQRRHPLGVSLLVEQLPRKADEAAEIAAGNDGSDDWAHDSMKDLAYAPCARM